MNVNVLLSTECCQGWLHRIHEYIQICKLAKCSNNSALRDIRDLVPERYLYKTKEADEIQATVFRNMSNK